MISAWGDAPHSKAIRPTGCYSNLSGVGLVWFVDPIYPVGPAQTTTVPSEGSASSTGSTVTAVAFTLESSMNVRLLLRFYLANRGDKLDRDRGARVIAKSEKEDARLTIYRGLHTSPSGEAEAIPELFEGHWEGVLAKAWLKQMLFKDEHSDPTHVTTMQTRWPLGGLVFPSDRPSMTHLKATKREMTTGNTGANGTEQEWLGSGLGSVKDDSLCDVQSAAGQSVNR
ncbi:hypothetical protein EYF80_018363 [Liparis tanakae]|uniref:Uncharacterized protein n=1 Tax=Liparis tanakae TaxID=230148 RepID=A0A4Z2I284_9TELE|nr:hypothetical protein EYF80_018363 [Liparis tanakae]